MSESSIAVTTGSGKNIHTYDRTISSVLVQDQFTVPGEYPLATYSITATAVVPAASAHILQIMAGASLNVRIRRVRIKQVTSANAVVACPFSIVRLTTAGTGGTAITPGKFDPDDAAAGCTGMTLPSSKGTESTILLESSMIMRQAVLATSAQTDDAFTWEQHPSCKPIIIKAGTSNGIAIKWGSTASTVHTVAIYVELVETSFAG